MVGTSCVGKSTVARALADTIGCTFVELDELYWGPGWTPKPDDEFRRQVTATAAGEAWVTAGNYGVIRDELWTRATTVVWLNFSFPRVLWQGIRRTVCRCLTRERLWEGNRESIRRSFFSKDSVLIWIITTYHRRRAEFGALRASDAYSHLSWIEFRDPSAANNFLASLRNSPDISIE